MNKKLSECDFHVYECNLWGTCILPGCLAYCEGGHSQVVNLTACDWMGVFRGGGLGHRDTDKKNVKIEEGGGERETERGRERETERKRETQRDTERQTE